MLLCFLVSGSCCQLSGAPQAVSTVRLSAGLVGLLLLHAPAVVSGLYGALWKGVGVIGDVGLMLHALFACQTGISMSEMSNTLSALL